MLLGAPSLRILQDTEQRHGPGWEGKGSAGGTLGPWTLLKEREILGAILEDLQGQRGFLSL